MGPICQQQEPMFQWKGVVGVDTKTEPICEVKTIDKFVNQKYCLPNDDLIVSFVWSLKGL